MDEMEKAAEMKQQFRDTLDALRDWVRFVESQTDDRSRDVEGGYIFTEDGILAVEYAVKWLEVVARKESEKLHALAEKHMAID